MADDGRGVEMAESFVCSLKCWSCGKTKPIETAGPPQFAHELVSWANQVGWTGVFDWNRHRTMVFCSDECVDAAKTKTGAFRARPPSRKV
jgi:hypothetical protein